MKNLNEISKIVCPVCGKSLVEEYEICSVCCWENDPNQLQKPNMPGGANKMSLTQAKQAYAAGKPIQ